MKKSDNLKSYKSTHGNEINRARKLCSDALKTAELVKSQLLKIYQADAERARIQAEREAHEQEAQRVKDEMWRLEAERRELEAAAAPPAAIPSAPPPPYEPPAPQLGCPLFSEIYLIEIML